MSALWSTTRVLNAITSIELHLSIHPFVRLLILPSTSHADNTLCVLMCSDGPAISVVIVMASLPFRDCPSLATGVETPGQMSQKYPVGFLGVNPFSMLVKDPPKKPTLNIIFVSSFINNEIFYYS